jgi:predicted metal-dependent HD superfamily phosphohydrolase
MTPERVESMQKEWVRLLAHFGVSAAAAYVPFDALVAAYSEPHRHYHNLEHLGEMFRVASRLATHSDDPVAVQLAIWFHDAIYDPRAKDNEARSAAFAAETLGSLGVPVATIERVASLVNATAHLAAAEPPADRDTVVLLDADLAILGAAEERYRRYAGDIRRPITARAARRC